MSIQNEELIEEILYEAHKLGIHSEVIERTLFLLAQAPRDLSGLSRCDAYKTALKQIKDENGI